MQCRSFWGWGVKRGDECQRHTYISAADIVFLVDTDHVDWVAQLERYKAETFLYVLLAIERLLDQVDLQNAANVQH